MKACYIERYGGLDVTRVGEVPDPKPKRGQVLVDVETASVNPVDWKIRRGDFRLITGRAFPKVLGIDFAGTVIDVGPDAKEVTVGDRVYGPTQLFEGKNGSHAERVAVKAAHLRRIPEGLSPLAAASLPGAGLTAVVGLRDFPALDGQNVLVNGATGGVGHFTVQIARARGANVTATCSAGSADFARELGAGDVLDYQSLDLAHAGQPYDIIFDAHGGLGFDRAANALSEFGTYVTTHAYPQTHLHAVWRRIVGKRGIVVAMMRTQAKYYAVLERLILDGHVKPSVHRTYRLDDAVSAFSALEQGGVRGKVVLQINPGSASAA